MLHERSSDHTQRPDNVTRLLRPPKRVPRMTPRALRRRHVKLVRDLAADLGITEPTATERVLLAQLATLVLRAAQLQALIERGGLTAKQGLELTKTTSESRRIFLLLRHEREPEPHVAFWERPLDEADSDAREPA
jgi:hypothetical protein